MDNNVIITSIIAALSVAIITGLFTMVVKYVRDLKSWRKNTIKDIKAILDADNDLFPVVKSANFIPTHGQDEGPHNSDEIIISDNRYPLVDKLLNDFVFIL